MTTRIIHPVTASSPVPSAVPAVRTGFIAMLSAWHRRWVHRRGLEEIEDHVLQDVGISRGTIRAEAEKPFWKR
jgi:uncharacterized protein YjiS (DUF1127 family)